MRTLLYRWNSPEIRPPGWMSFAYYSVERNQNLYVAVPFGLLVSVAWMVQDAWARKAGAPSWIEREVRRRTIYLRLHGRSRP